MRILTLLQNYWRLLDDLVESSEKQCPNWHECITLHHHTSNQSAEILNRCKSGAVIGVGGPRYSITGAPDLWGATALKGGHSLKL